MKWLEDGIFKEGGDGFVGTAGGTGLCVIVYKGGAVLEEGIKKRKAGGVGESGYKFFGERCVEQDAFGYSSHLLFWKARVKKSFWLKGDKIGLVGSAGNNGCGVKEGRFTECFYCERLIGKIVEMKERVSHLDGYCFAYFCVIWMNADDVVFEATIKRSCAGENILNVIAEFSDGEFRVA